MLARSLAQHAEHGLGLLGIAQRGVATLVGWVDYLRPEDTSPLEIGYALLPSMWGRGIAVEASRAVMTWGVEHAGRRESAVVCVPAE